MNEALRGWHERELQDLAAVSPESLASGTARDYLFRYIDLTSVDRGTIIWETTSLERFSSAPSRARRRVRAHDVLFGTVRPALQSHAAIGDRVVDELVASTGFSVLRAHAGISDPRFLFHYVMSQQAMREARRAEVGSNYPAVNESDVRRFRVLAPPLSEQRRIAEILDTLDDLIRKTEEVIAKLKQVKQGLLHDLLTRGIDESGELRDPERHPDQFKDYPLGSIPRCWEIDGPGYYLDDTTGVKPGPFGSSIKKTMYTTSGYRVYGQEQVIAGDLGFGDYYISASKFGELSAFSVDVGDVLVSLVGTVGRALVVREPFEPGIINPRLVRLRPNRAKADVEFFKHLFVSPLTRRQLERQATGGTMPVLNSRVIRGLRLPAIPLKEQTAMAAFLDNVDERIATEAQAGCKLRTARQGVMEDLLSGRVRVTDLEAA